MVKCIEGLVVWHISRNIVVALHHKQNLCSYFHYNHIILLFVCMVTVRWHIHHSYMQSLIDFNLCVDLKPHSAYFKCRIVFLLLKIGCAIISLHNVILNRMKGFIVCCLYWWVYLVRFFIRLGLHVVSMGRKSYKLKQSMIILCQFGTI